MAITSIGLLGLITPCLPVESAVAQSASVPSRSDNLIFGGGLEHTVLDMGRSIAFYRSVLGLDVNDPRPSPDPAVLKYMDSVGGKLTVTAVKLPGEGLRSVELAEIIGIDRKPANVRIQDPGATILALEVRDLGSMFERLKKEGTPIVTPGGKPVSIDGKGTQGVIVKDPDGFFILLLQSAAPLRAAAAQPGGNVISARFGVTIGDTDKTMRVYRDVMGYDPQIGSFTKDAEILTSLNKPGLQLRVTKATIPGSTIPMEFLEFKNISRKPMQAANRDPGTALLHYTVRDIDAMVGQLKAAGATVISNGGVPVTDSGNDRVIILRDPNNFFIDLHQKPKNIG